MMNYDMRKWRTGLGGPVLVCVFQRILFLGEEARYESREVTPELNRTVLDTGPFFR